VGEDRDLHPVVEVEFAQQTRDVGLTVASLMNNDLPMSAFDRPVATATSTDRPISTTPVRPQWLGRLFDVELRKTVDTRAGRLMIATVLLLASAIATWASLRTWGGADNQLLFGDVLRAVTLPVTLLLPVVGVLAMTSEWSQRTALTTFTLSSKRTRVLLCKVGGGAAAEHHRHSDRRRPHVCGRVDRRLSQRVHAGYAGMVASVSSIFIAVCLSTLMGAAFGALLSITPAALVADFAAPLIWSQVGEALFKSASKWLDITNAIGNISSRHLHGVWPQTLTSIAVWIIIPLIAGLVVSSRREVK